MNKIPLLPCPCCGSAAIYTETCLIDSYSDHDIIACTKCSMMNDNANAEEWNKRPDIEKFNEFVNFCFEHGGTLRNHKAFGEMARSVRENITIPAVLERL
jgi:transcription elongation factor Elf1